MLLVLVVHYSKVIVMHIVSHKLKVFLVKEDLQLHESCILFPDALINARLNPIQQLLLKRESNLLLHSDWVYPLIKQQISISASFKEPAISWVKVIEHVASVVGSVLIVVASKALSLQVLNLEFSHVRVIELQPSVG